MKVDIWTLKYGWPEGESTWAFGSRQAAESHLHDIVAQQWADGCMDNEPQPISPKEAIETYFEYMDGDAWHDIERHKVDIPLDIPKDEVILTEDEVEIVLWSLKQANPYSAGKDLEVGPGEALSCINSARDKLED